LQSDQTSTNVDFALDNDIVYMYDIFPRLETSALM